jgi:hypothetical protein
MGFAPRSVRGPTPIAQSISSFAATRSASRTAPVLARAGPERRERRDSESAVSGFPVTALPYLRTSCLTQLQTIVLK